MSELIFTRLKELAAQVKPIFLRWEKLRILYNLLLLGFTLAVHANSTDFFQPVILAICLVGAVLANLCYLAGPLAQCYFHWLGLRGRWVTGLIFLVGVLVSLPLVLFFLTGSALAFWGL